MLETKFEYQVSPELAEKIAIEQVHILLRLRWFNLRYLPLATGFLAILLMLLMPGFLNNRIGPRNITLAGVTLQIGGSNYNFSESFFIYLSLGFVFGFVFGVMIIYFVRWIILAAARSAYAKMGPARTVSWNEESLTFQSLAYETKVGWPMIDRIKLGDLGVYAFSGRRALFVIPREAFPPNATTDDLIRAWQNGKQQPSITA